MTFKLKTPTQLILLSATTNYFYPSANIFTGDVKMNCCGTHEKKEGEEEKHEHGKEEHSHTSHAGCGMHGGGWLYWILVGTFIYLVVAYIFTYVI